MRRRGMILAGGAAIIAALVGGTVEAQDKPCDARPRWLVVTVVRGDLYVRAEDDAGWEKSEVFSKETGAQMLDRCVASWSGIEESDAEPPIQSVFSVQGADSFFTYYVAETVQEICAVLDDCGDATTGKVE